MEYSLAKGISLSTLRRYIKAGKVEFRVDHGRYLLFDRGASAPPASGQFQSMSETTSLEKELQRAREEIAELKTLIAFYEESLPRTLDL